MPTGHAYSGAELRVRDKAIEERYSRQIREVEDKARRLRHAYDECSKEHWAFVNYANGIARRLGDFPSLKEVDTFIRLADEQIPYEHLVGRVEELKSELSKEKREKESMQYDLADVMEERDRLKEALAEQSAKFAASSAQDLARGLVDLQQQLMTVQENANRASAHFKESYGKWHAFKKWMQAEEKTFAERTKGVRGAEKARLRGVLYTKRRQKVKEMGLDSDDDDGLDQVVGQETPAQVKTHSNIPSSSSPTVVASGNTTPAQKIGDVTAVVSSNRTPLQFVPVSSKPMTTEPQTSSPAASSPPTQSKDFIDLSETDDDSQGALPPAHKAPTKPPEEEVIVVDHRPAAKTAKKALPAPHPTLPSRPSFPQFGGGEMPKRPRHSDVFSSTTTRQRPDSEDVDEERPRKTRRFSSPVRSPLAAIPAVGLRASRDGANVSRASRGRENRVDRHTNGENAPASTPANGSGNKQITDYSAFKGRGRYGKASAGDDTINASYAIDPARNNGVDFQYDAVVRGKEDRRRMLGGDCECCRDYYEAVGPLPSRLQPPLWRSPPNSPEKNRPCRKTDGASGSRKADAAAVASHKQDISRHRHNWAQGITPPDYWNIGFPSTQEAEKINERAAVIHQQKRRRVEEEAERGGRYYKTR
ncbi:hypothetical protein B0H16DRAFT_1487726 [Mycena metata]|uniref:DNA endonuclease activator Ctp1 C-terminal domain-containing protein n=1 Tax=Mycena metata TaxID=1033252 RepID=A0AAD7KKJ5_9AGAR|nr:hypothetical protein B0H16DRAFT_1487726 [Mycena metata]